MLTLMCTSTCVLSIKFVYCGCLQEEMERLKAAISKLQSGEGEEDSEEKVIS